MKHLFVLAVWVVAGGLLAVIGQAAWSRYSRKEPESARTVAEQLRSGVESGKAVVNRVSDEVQKATAANADSGDKSAPAAGQATEPAAKQETEDEINERLHQLADEGENSTDAENVNVASTSVPAEIERQRRQEALMRRQLRIVDELYGNE